ncbi:MAG: glycosyltransferase family 2 protein [Gemmatimonas sp.]
MLTAHDWYLALLFSLPWIVLPFVAVRRQRRSVSLDSYDSNPNVAHPERVSIVLPARNEAAHIAACVQSLRATSWLNVEIIVVNDHSDDHTAALAQSAAQRDPRVTVIDAADLPSDWFGKQWACHCGVQHTTGSLLLFTDADTRHAPDLIARLVHARASRDAGLMSVAGTQEMVSFWERAIQPAVFAILLARFGGTLEIENAKHSADVIANGQCFMMTRAAYDKVGGHAAVKGTVAEDLMMAQRTHEAGFRVSLLIGTNQLSTRMYDGFRSIVRGWMKNVYAGGRMAMRGGFFGRLVFPLALVGTPLFIILPMLVGVARILMRLGGSHTTAALSAWCWISTIALLVFFATINRFARTPMWRVIFVPLGMMVFAIIGVASVVRGQTVEWKGRVYQSS